MYNLLNQQIMAHFVGDAACGTGTLRSLPALTAQESRPRYYGSGFTALFLCA